MARGNVLDLTFVHSSGVYPQELIAENDVGAGEIEKGDRDDQGIEDRKNQDEMYGKQVVRQPVLAELRKMWAHCRAGNAYVIVNGSRARGPQALARVICTLHGEDIL